mgnify:CR=1 FL=1
MDSDVMEPGLEERLAADFTHGAQWPVDRASLAALLDLGLDESTIAGYFHVVTAEVTRLRRRYAV